MGLVGHSLYTVIIFLLVCQNIPCGSSSVISSDNLSNYSYLCQLNNSTIFNCSLGYSHEWYPNNTSCESLPEKKDIDMWVSGPGLPPPGWIFDANLPNLSDNSTKII